MLRKIYNRHICIFLNSLFAVIGILFSLFFSVFPASAKVVVTDWKCANPPVGQKNILWAISEDENSSVISTRTMVYLCRFV